MVLLNSKFALAAYIVFITSVSASPIQERTDAVRSIKITKQPNKLSAKDVLSKDKGRINSFGNAAYTGNPTATNADTSYQVTVQVGTENFYNMIVDTGLANTWVSASSPYISSGTCSWTFSDSYGSGNVSSMECVDKVTIGGLTVQQQSFGSASSSSGFNPGVDGIFGVGPVDLTEGTVSDMITVPTFLDNLYSEGTISQEVLGVYLQPESGSDSDDQNGELTLGDVDTTKFIPPLTYFPKSMVFPYSNYWGIDIASVTYDGETLSGYANAIVDTGTTLIHIPTSAYNEFLSAAGGMTDPLSGLAVFSTKPTGNVTFTFGLLGLFDYPLTPDQYLIPVEQYATFGLNSSQYYSWIGDGRSDGSNVDFTIGQKFLENYYSVYNATNFIIGFAVRSLLCFIRAYHSYRPCQSLG